MRPITLATEPAKSYTFKGASILNDGLYGDGNYRSGRYLGFYGTDMDATIDLMNEQTVSSAFISTYLVPGDYIFGLAGMEVYASTNGKDFKKVASQSLPILEKGSKNNVSKCDSMSFEPVQARYIRLVGKCTPTLPKWHKGAGKTAYLFIDEIGVK